MIKLQLKREGLAMHRMHINKSIWCKTIIALGIELSYHGTLHKLSLCIWICIWKGMAHFEKAVKKLNCWVDGMKNIRYWKLFSLLIFKDFTWDKFLLMLRQVHPIELLTTYGNNAFLHLAFSDFSPLQKVVSDKNNFVANLIFSLELLFYKVYTN